MRMYIDTEFNEFRGDLISMRIVAKDGNEFYEVLECKNPGSWVAEHVMPILEKEPIDRSIFQTKLHKFLFKYDSIHLVADWPEDMKHFCESLITGPGMCLNYPPLTMECRRDLSDKDIKVPHNALHDARAIADQDMSSKFV